MLLTLLLFLSGLSLSSISAVYAIIGLLSIFPAAPTTIVIMGSALEVSKLVIASWLYRNWIDIPKFLKIYFCIAMVILMLLTSMSIFGMLSKAHIDSGLVSGESVAALQIVDEKIATQKENIVQSKKALSQMDQQVNEMLSRTTDANGTSKAVSIRKQQKAERTSLNMDVIASQLIISKLQTERVPLATSVRKVEAEVGPIRYIATLIYGDKIDDTILEKAVRVVILMIVFVFDPLAVLLLIAANWNLKHHKTKRESVSSFTDTNLSETIHTLNEQKNNEVKTEVHTDGSNEIRSDNGLLPEKEIDELVKSPKGEWYNAGSEIETDAVDACISDMHPEFDKSNITLGIEDEKSIKTDILHHDETKEIQNTIEHTPDIPTTDIQPESGETIMELNDGDSSDISAQTIGIASTVNTQDSTSIRIHNDSP